MDLRQLVMLVLQASVLCTVVGFGLKTTTADLLTLARRPGLLARSVVAVFVIMPVVAVLLVKAFDFQRTVEIGLLALSISPMPPMLPRRQAKFAGQSSYALALMAVLSILAVVTVPLGAFMLGRVFGRPVLVAPASVARIVLLTVLVPLAAGMALAALAPRLAAALEKPIAFVAGLLLPVAAVVLVFTAPAVWALIGNGTILAIVIFLVAGLAVGHVLGGSEPEHSVVLALSTACRHPGVALMIAGASFPDEQFGGVILLYLLLGVIVGAPYLAWRRRQASAASHEMS